MGWKSEKDIERKEAIALIVAHLMDISDDELSNALTSLGFGDDKSLPHYGYNFNIVDTIESDDHKDDYYAD